MNLRGLMDQLLSTGASALGQAGSLGQNTQGNRPGTGSDMGKYATGAAVGGVLGLLLGSGRGRQVGGKALKYGSVAAIGALAWKVYNDHQAKQAAAASAPTTPVQYRPPSAQRFDALPAPQAEMHGQAMLKAMIAAAKSDGHMDERERGLVEAELGRLQADPAMRSWVETELRRPVEPRDVAAAATTPEMAAEIYLATLLVVDETSTMERAYLDALARELRLADGLKADLEARANAA
jgi:uncharacterized membrane protein YebE (DUF533 family)